MSATKSIIRWVSAFLLADVVLGLFLLTSCLVDPDLCGVGSSFIIGMFYTYPFGVVVSSGLNFATTLLLVPLVSILWRIILGVAIGYLTRNKSLGWPRIISITMAIFLLMSFVPMLIIGLINPI